MKAFFSSLLHAAFGGAIAGAAAAQGTSSWKTIGLAAAGSAISSVISFFAQSPLAKK